MSASSPSHAVLMDRNYRFQRHIYDVTRKHYLFGRDLLIERLKPPIGGTVLEVGSGTASNLIAAAGRYPAVSLYGVDISSMMLATARNTIEKRGLSHRIRLQLADAAKLEAQAYFGEAAFDRVFFSYSLSMIPDWRAALAAALAHVKPGGALHLVDFGRMEDLPRAARNGLRLWLKFYSVTPRDEAPAELARLAESEGAQFDMCSLRRGYAVYVEIVRGA